VVRGKASGKLPDHPSAANEATRLYAQQLADFLRGEGNQYPMSKLGVLLKRPEGALKIGKLMKIYTAWFRRSGDKGDLLLSSVLVLMSILLTSDSVYTRPPCLRPVYTLLQLCMPPSHE
jgi:hypothetical protein